MDICVLSRVGGVRLGKLVSILSNENKHKMYDFPLSRPTKLVLFFQDLRD